MADGTWDDFFSKGGFADGAATVRRIDERARTNLVRMINELLEAATSNSRAFAYDRPGLHNGLMILFAAKDCPEDAGQWKAEQFETVLPSDTGPPELQEQLEWLGEGGEDEWPSTREELVEAAYREAHEAVYSVDRELVDKLIEAVDSYLAREGADESQDELGRACDALKGALA